MPQPAARNHWALDARLVEIGAMRSTPAGLPAVDCVLEHSSEVVQAGCVRQISMAARAVAVGPQADQLAALPIGAQARFEGFMAAVMHRGRPGKTLVLHIAALRAHTVIH